MPDGGQDLNSKVEPQGRPSTDDQRSTAIAIARVICISGIVYVHGWTGASVPEVQQQAFTRYGILYWFLIEAFGRSSVPLLSIISGFLVASSVRKRSYRVFIGGKAVSLLAPMAAWNLIAVFLVGLAVLGLGYHADFEPVGLPLADEVIHLAKGGTINYQNAFLRDVFVCMLAAPWLLRRSAALLWGLAVVAAVWSIGEWHLYILLRPQILLFFLVGIIAGRTDLDQAVRRFPLTPIVVAFFLVGGLKTWTSMLGLNYVHLHPYLGAALDNLLRFIAAAVFWRAALWLAHGRLSPILLAIEPYMFMVFCSHVIIVRSVGPLAGKLFGAFGQPLWMAYFIMQPLVALAGAWMMARLLLYCSPSMAGLMSGGRLVKKHRL